MSLIEKTGKGGRDGGRDVEGEKGTDFYLLHPWARLKPEARTSICNFHWRAGILSRKLQMETNPRAQP